MTNDRFQATVAAELQWDPKRPRAWLIQSLVPPRDLHPAASLLAGIQELMVLGPRLPLGLGPRLTLGLGLRLTLGLGLRLPLGSAAVDGSPALPVLPRFASAAASYPPRSRSRWNCGWGATTSVRTSPTLAPGRIRQGRSGPRSQQM